MLKKNTHFLLFAYTTVFSLILVITSSTVSADIDQVTANQVIGKTRTQIMSENPWLVKQISRGGGFGNNFSRAIAHNMYSRTNQAALQDAREKLVVTKLADRTWVLQFPIVNVAVFETDQG